MNVSIPIGIEPFALQALFTEIARFINGSRKTANIGSPAAVGANSTAEHTVTLLGLAVGDFVSVVKPTHQAGLIVGSSRVSAPNTLAISYQNTSGGPITPTPGEVYIVCHFPA